MSKPFVEGPSWSNSRIEMFSRCKTEYFFDRIASKNGWDSRKATREQREAFILKNTRNRYAWSGEMIHTAIEDWIDSFQKNCPLSRDTLLQRTDAVMRQQFRESRDQKYRDNPKRSLGLIEHENGLDIPNDKWKDLHENTMHCLINFFYTDFYKSITDTGLSGVIKPERLDHFILDNIKVYARPDVAIKRKEFLRLLDWKTGKENDNNDSQMVFYALYAIKKLRYPLEAIGTELIYLRDNHQKEVFIGSEAIQNAENYICSSHKEMMAFEASLSQATSAETLPACTSSGSCLTCRFRKICPHALKLV